MHVAFKTLSNAIELAMIASSTALMQACKRVAPSAGVVSLTECSAEFRAQASGLQCTSYRSTNACVAVNCIRCGRLTMVAGSATLVQGCERSFSGQGPGLLSKCSAEVLDGQLVSAVLRSSVR